MNCKSEVSCFLRRLKNPSLLAMVPYVPHCLLPWNHSSENQESVVCCNRIAVKYRCAASEAVRYTGCKAAWEQSRSPLINTGKVKGVVLTVHDLSCTKKKRGNFMCLFTVHNWKGSQSVMRCSRGVLLWLGLNPFLWLKRWSNQHINDTFSSRNSK